MDKRKRMRLILWRDDTQVVPYAKQLIRQIRFMFSIKLSHQVPLAVWEAVVDEMRTNLPSQKQWILTLLKQWEMSQKSATNFSSS